MAVASSCRALIVDDEIDICFLLANILNGKQFETRYVTSLTAARQLLAKEDFELIFLDNNLPDGTGIEFISYIRGASSDTKIIMITAYDDISNRKKAYESGVDYFMPKPLHSSAIDYALKSVLKD